MNGGTHGGTLLCRISRSLWVHESLTRINVVTAKASGTLLNPGSTTFKKMDHYYGDMHNMSYLEMVWSAVARIGWYLVVIAILFCYMFPSLRKKYTKWKLKKAEEAYAAKYHADPDLLYERLSKLEASRQKMQERYQENSILVQRMVEERKRKKREDALRSKKQHTIGKRLGDRSDAASCSTEGKPQSVKKEYKPLVGDTSRSYRPPKRGCCGGGGKGNCG